MTEKRLRVAVVMDPIEDIKPAKDTTLAMMLAAQRRGWELAYLELRPHVAARRRRDGPRPRDRGARRRAGTGLRGASRRRRGSATST